MRQVSTNFFLRFGSKPDYQFKILVLGDAEGLKKLQSRRNNHSAQVRFGANNVRKSNKND